MSQFTNMMVELRGAMAMAGATEAFCDAMGDRDYEQAHKVAGSMLVLSAALLLSKDAKNVPSPDEIISLSEGTLAAGVSILRGVEAQHVTR